MNVIFQLHEKYDPNLINDVDEREMLRRRRQTAHRITYQAALSHRHSIAANSDDGSQPEEYKVPRRKLLSGIFFVKFQFEFQNQNN